jgi:HEPN domain-containing protein
VNKNEKVAYWLQSAEYDWQVANHLFEKGDYPYALFFGQLSVEKILKALYVVRLNENPPYTHRLVYLAEKISLTLTEEQLELLEIITDFNIEARYPDEKFSFKKKCTREFTKEFMNRIEEMKRWLQKQLL